MFSAIDKAWKQFILDSMASKTNLPQNVLNNLDAYSYFWTVISIAANHQINDTIEFYLYRNYMLPSLQTDVGFISKNPLLLDQNLIWAGSLANTIIIGEKYYSDTGAFGCLYAIAKSLSQQLLAFQNANVDTTNSLKKLLSILNNNSCELESKKYFIDNNVDSAYAFLLTGISSNKFYKPRAVTFAKSLIGHYMAAGEKEKSLALLNNLALNISNDILPADTLREWYRQVDPINGLDIYRAIEKERTRMDYVVSVKHPIRLPQKWNFMANAIPTEKLKAAKYILVDFWYSACSPCIAEIPALNDLYNKLKNNTDVIFVSVNTDFTTTNKNEQYIQALIKQHQIQFPVVYDNTQVNLSGQLNISGYPSKFILNIKGEKIVKADSSMITLGTFYNYINTIKTKPH
ncbi:TlpA family protein disulfide reductase [Parafilimonas sp.]|uniref:TlpA family protein disulfide reductase n=1 Tax=Parafilimonas sp. TaxID=1969739 RepID=UPI003F7E09B7